MKTPSRRLTSIVLLIALAAIAAPRMAGAQDLTATFQFPTDLATAVNMSTAVQWTTVAGAEAYYLDLGTSLGASNVANSGELHVTSYKAINVPVNVPIYARLWTVVSGEWRFVDITFTAAAADYLDFTYPVPNALAADMAQPFEWNAVPNAEAYYLWVGTSAGLADASNSGELQTTSYLAYNLPLHQTLYLKLWVELDGIWRSVDRTLVATNTATQLAQFIYPTNGAANVDVDQAITWSTALHAQKYYLQIGTTAGGSNLVNSGETTETSWDAPNLPTGQTLYARIWTVLSGTWRHTDITFTAAPGTVPTFIYPQNATTMDISRTFTWTSVAKAQAYQLLVGSTPGSSNVISSGAINGTSFSAASLPTTGTFYARAMARVAGVWRTSGEISFSTSPLTASLITPADGSTSFVASATPFTWTSVPFAEKYYLYVGTYPGGNDLIDSQELCDQAGCNGGPLATSWNGLDGGNSIGLGQIETVQTLYARLWTVVGGIFRPSDSTFTTATLIPIILDPLDGSTKISVHPRYTWTMVPGATAYRVTVQLLCDETHSCTDAEKIALLEESGDLTPTKQDLKAGTMSYTSQREPPYTKLVVKVYAQVGGVWRYAQSSYTHRRQL